MATDPNQILATAVPTAMALAPASGQVNPWFGRPQGNPANAPFDFPHGGMSGLLQAAQAADPNAWTSFLAQPWAQHLQQRYGLTPDVLNGLQSMLAGMNAPQDARQYFRSNYGPQMGAPAPALPPQQVGMVPGVTGSMGTNPAAGQDPVMAPGPVIAPQPAAPPQQQQQGWRTNPMLPANFGNFSGFGGQGQSPIAGLARQPGAPGFGL